MGFAEQRILRRHGVSRLRLHTAGFWSVSAAGHGVERCETLPRGVAWLRLECGGGRDVLHGLRS